MRMENVLKAEIGNSVQKTDSLSSAEFDALYDEHKTAVFRFAYYLTQNRGEAEDLFQETWLRVVKNFPKISKESTFISWILTIAANLHRDALRKKRIRRLFLLQKYKAFKQGENIVSVSTGKKVCKNSKAEDQKDLSMALSKALTQLPERQRLIFVLKEIEGFKQTEISEMLKIPIGTVKSLMYRAVKGLQRDLSAYKPKPYSLEERTT